MNKLGEIPGVVLQDDGWEYDCKAFSDVLDIKYKENDVLQSQFSIPMYCAKQVLEALLELVSRRDGGDDA